MKRLRLLDDRVKQKAEAVLGSATKAHKTSYAPPVMFYQLIESCFACLILRQIPSKASEADKLWPSATHFVCRWLHTSSALMRLRACTERLIARPKMRRKWLDQIFTVSRNVLKCQPQIQDLAIDLRVRLGDWFRVIQLAHGANEERETLPTSHPSNWSFFGKLLVTVTYGHRCGKNLCSIGGTTKGTNMY